MKISFYGVYKDFNVADLEKICRRPSPKPVSLSRALTFLILLVCVSPICLTGVLGWKSRAEWLNNARTATENLTYSIAQHAEATFSQTDSVVVDIVERIKRDGIGADKLPYLKSALVNKVAQQPQLHGLFVYDETGRRVVHSRASTPTSANNSDRSLIGQDTGIVNSGFHSDEFLSNIRSTIASGSVWKGETKNRACLISTLLSERISLRKNRRKSNSSMQKAY